MSAFATVDAYAESLPPPHRERLDDVRALIRREVPQALETVSYGIAAFRCARKTFLYAGCWSGHLGLYPVAEGDAELESALRPYRRSRATLHFDHSAPLPIDLIARIIRAQHAVHCPQPKDPAA